MMSPRPKPSRCPFANQGGTRQVRGRSIEPVDPFAWGGASGLLASWERERGIGPLPRGDGVRAPGPLAGEGLGAPQALMEGGASGPFPWGRGLKPLNFLVRGGASTPSTPYNGREPLIKRGASSLLTS
ncbi:hypothetical protein CRG98_030567 [Punica granatum]|uniref:Uncharacterized protein n=1 Tax=Punica granatum TaxID=22663 RepID=A0A2I0IZ80_PUNGR|nr:hypothetical protein CRG98_030567 [Punica granatum]